MFVILYIFLTAKPISLRRLSLLFVLAWAVVTVTLDTSRLRHGPTETLITATTLTLLVWCFPLIRTVTDSFQARALSLDALSPVSATIQWSYGIVLAGTPLLAIGVVLSPNHHLTIAALSQFSCWRAASD
jgi:hypothetical protein